MDVLYIFLILIFAALMLGFAAACASLAPKSAASKKATPGTTNGGRS